MKKILLAATASIALAGAATAASAANFVGSYSAAYYGDSGNEQGNNADNGLEIDLQDLTAGAGTGFSFPLTAGNSTTVNLFTISTPEGNVDSDDTALKSFALTFNFTAPSNGSTTIEGDTYGVTLNANFDEGRLVWDGSGTKTINFGTNGLLTIDLSDVTFDRGAGQDKDLGNSPATVAAKFTLAAPATSAVPEPMSWALMLAGFFGLGAALRANRRQSAALTA